MSNPVNSRRQSGHFPLHLAQFIGLLWTKKMHTFEKLHWLCKMCTWNIKRCKRKLKMSFNRCCIFKTLQAKSSLLGIGSVVLSSLSSRFPLFVHHFLKESIVSHVCSIYKSLQVSLSHKQVRKSKSVEFSASPCKSFSFSCKSLRVERYKSM